MPLTLHPCLETSLPIDVARLDLTELRAQSAADVEKIPLWWGNREVPCGELFSVTGSARDDETLLFEGNFSHVKQIGAGLASGTIRVIGDAGMHCGAGMRGGQIEVRGDAGDWTGAEMLGGRIHVSGDVGHQAGGAYPGSVRGMRGGELTISGNAGHELGARMRRGLIAVAASAGAACGRGMIAGTVLVAGACGRWCGQGMKRGTIVVGDAEVHDQNSPGLSPVSFQAATTMQPVFLQLYLRHLRRSGFPVPEFLFSSRYLQFRGDLLELGLGEVLIPVKG